MSANNYRLRKAIIKNVNAGIFSVCETHLKHDEKIDIDGHIWIGWNTCISGKGKSVVGYICVPHNGLRQFKSFEVLTCWSIVEQYNLFSLVGVRCKVHIHSVLLTKFNSSCDPSTKREDAACHNKSYKLKQTLNDFFSSDLTTIAIQTLISRIKTARETNKILLTEFIRHFVTLLQKRWTITFRGIIHRQCEDTFDWTYTELCDTIIKQMDNPCYNSPSKTRKR